MRLLSAFIVTLVILSCASKNVGIIKHEEPDALPTDTLSNYSLFDYINSLSEENYTIILDSIKNELSSDFFTLRMAFTHTKEYSPYGSDLADSLKRVSELIDSLKYDSAISALNRIQKIEYVNIPSHLYFGYIYNQLGDSAKSKFHYYIYEGLLNSIYQSGDGRTPQTGYIVISTKEEYQFLNWFDLQFHRQSLIDKDDYSFDLMRVTDPNTDEELEIYFNIELAISRLRDAFSK